MTMTRNAARAAFLLTVLLMSGAFGSPSAHAAELGDYVWKSRPLLLFAPTDRDPRLVETLRQLEASRCEFNARDMVLGLVVSQGDSTLDGQALTTAESQRLRDQFAVATNTFTALLIGKDGSEKYRVGGVPDLQTIYAVIDGMPMRRNEMRANPGQC